MGLYYAATISPVPPVICPQGQPDRIVIAVASGDVSLGWEGGCRRSHSPSEITNCAVTIWGEAQPACAQFGFSLPKTLPSLPTEYKHRRRLCFFF